MEQCEITCINCPLGCKMTVSLVDGAIQSIKGNSCKKGELYARKEVMNPKRIVTSTILVRGGKGPLVPCKTKTDIPKQMIFACMEEINKTVINAPIHIGDVLIIDVAGTGVDVVATKNQDKANG